MVLTACVCEYTHNDIHCIIDSRSQLHGGDLVECNLFSLIKAADEKESNIRYSSNGWKGNRQRDRQKVNSEEERVGIYSYSLQCLAAF